MRIQLFVPPPGRYLGDRVWVFPDHDNRWDVLTDAAELREALGFAALRLVGRIAQFR
ncbi:hypothetical protein I5Q34_04810 [Streptomyces sp. AV19]|uniref:hypothetical protein n=1 Tax=Streptomyces sp. AV19 TaxID=2793068 RepID=UPI0018FEB321|nr:hypothetical protein [Streptomyces sp. AV19]MBH1933619.1 hypothetical protein [Streptomyces sp. AV19]MDG4535875.1 hypothetical protein [Streptomyces sp. AV19]